MAPTTTRALLRGAALSTLLTTIGHLTGSPHLLRSLWTPAHAGDGVASVMQATRVDAMGFETSVFDFYAGFGWQVGAYLLGQVVVIWLLADVSGVLSVARLRVWIGVLFLEFLAAAGLALLIWKSFWVPAVANAVPAAFLGAAWISVRGPREQSDDRAGLVTR